MTTQKTEPASGPMQNFNLKAFIECAQELVRCDEVERALNVLDNLPGYYRDHVPQEVHELKYRILERLATPRSYSVDPVDSDYTAHAVKGEIAPRANWTLRSKLITRDVEILNAEGLVPTIIDFGPGEYSLPILLKHAGVKFKYMALYLNHKAHQIITPHIEDVLIERVDFSEKQPTIYVACEIIEHLWHELEMRTEMLQSCGLADIVHVSTPKYTYTKDRGSWDSIPHLGHLRTYTPKEFLLTIKKHFYEYSQSFYDHDVMHIRCVKGGTPFKVIEENALKEILGL